MIGICLHLPRGLQLRSLRIKHATSGILALAKRGFLPIECVGLLGTTSLGLEPSRIGLDNVDRRPYTLSNQKGV